MTELILPLIYLSFSQSAQEVDAYDFVEITLRVPKPMAANPFTDVSLTGQFQRKGGEPVFVDGFCDSMDGSIYRIRFMPTRPGDYTYTVAYRQGAQTQTFQGAFRARDARRRGLLRVDREYPWHFVWEGTGERFFWNSTTTYWLAGWQDDAEIRRIITRLHRLGVNRLRVALSGRVKDGQAWKENVYPDEKFRFILDPWVTVRPQSVENPGFDVTRFNVAYWQRYERLLRYARERDILVSVIFYLDGARPGADPFGKANCGGEDEKRYYRYAAARLAAFSNVMWDVTNEYHLFRDEAWVDQMGAFLKACDPYKHLMSVHGFEEFRFRTAAWADFAMYQAWDASGGHAFMLKNRQLQAATGRPMPQVNEEYGYEDHYPHWGGDPTGPPARSGDNRRRLAWEITMAGGYQTTGERAEPEKGWKAGTGGGWINGRGDSTMVMLEGYRHMVRFFTRLEWWKMEPRDDLVSGGAFCLAEPGKQYVIYLPKGGAVTARLEPGTYRARWFNPRSGRYHAPIVARGPAWTSPPAPDSEDWVILLQKGG